MICAIITIVLVLAAVVIAAGFRRIHPPRASGAEGIEDREAAKAYDRIGSWPQFRLLRRWMARKVASRRPSGVLVDIGCGPGRLIQLLARRHPALRIIGVDLAGEMIKRAEDRVSAPGIAERVEFRQGDAMALPLPDCSVDFAISSLSLHHWSAPEQGLAEIHRILKPGGQLLLFDLRRDPRRIFYCLLRFAQRVVVPAALRRINEPLGSLLSSYTPEELDNMFCRLLFRRWKIEGGSVFVFVTACKE